MGTFLFALVSSVLAANAQSAPNPVAARVVELRGEARVGERKLAIGAEIRYGETVRAASGARLRLRVGSLAAVQISGVGTGGGEFSLNEGAGHLPLELNLREGAAFAYVKPEKAGAGPRRAARFRLRTPSAVMGVRGTTLYVEAGAGQPEFVCVCHGKVEVEWGRRARVIESRHHDAPVRIPAEAARDLVPTEQGRGHTDEEGQALKKIL